MFFLNVSSAFQCQKYALLFYNVFKTRPDMVYDIILVYFQKCITIGPLLYSASRNDDNLLSLGLIIINATHLRIKWHIHQNAQTQKMRKMK